MKIDSLNFPESKESKCLLILSGGMDSGVLLKDLLDRDFKVSCISFDYQAKHSLKEISSAKDLVNKFSVKHEVLELAFINKYFNSSLLSSGKDIPLGSYDQSNMSSTVVPFRNGIMLSIAAGIAESRDIPYIFIGTHSGDSMVYPDCRENFNTSMNEAVSLGTDKKVSFFAPYQALTKKQIADIGNSLNFPFELTWTCYQGKEKHCGECAACLSRKTAIGKNDKTDYIF